MREFRTRDAATPVVLMGYLNPIEIHGMARFAAEAREAGVDGVLLVDCPVEEIDSTAAIHAAGLARIFLAAPTTADARLAAICAAAEGFLYYVSFAGITGADRLSMDDVRARVALIKRSAKTPVAVGFGVRDATVGGRDRRIRRRSRHRQRAGRAARGCDGCDRRVPARTRVPRADPFRARCARDEPCRIVRRRTMPNYRRAPSLRRRSNQEKLTT